MGGVDQKQAIAAQKAFLSVGTDKLQHTHSKLMQIAEKIPINIAAVNNKGPEMVGNEKHEEQKIEIIRNQQRQ